MKPSSIEMDETFQSLSADPLPFARSYQLEALEKALKHNTIVFLETGSGKTLIAIMLLRSHAYLLRKPSPSIAVFLVPKVVLVPQQAEAVKKHTDLNVGMYWGDMGVDFWDAEMWKKEVERYEVLVMTPAILLNNLRHSFFTLSMIKVLVFDECHHTGGKHAYACIMAEFYHRQLCSGKTDLPRIFGMTASPIKSKGDDTELSCWQKIHKLEELMNSKVYTCVSESVIAEFVPFSTPKFRFYHKKEIPYAHYARLKGELEIIEDKHQLLLNKRELSVTTSDSVSKKISKIFSNLIFCLDELGFWLAFKAAHCFVHNKFDCLLLEIVDVRGEMIVKDFCSDAFQAMKTFIPVSMYTLHAERVDDLKTMKTYIPMNLCWGTIGDVKGSTNDGLFSEKVVSLVELLLDYSKSNDLRCIVFVERVITAVVIQSLLSELLPKHNNWKTKYIAGNNGLQAQTRKKQNEIVEQFRKGMVNIIVATSILEEGLDVQSCNLVVRFDPCSTVCSFIQSRGRARMLNSDYVLMVESGDHSTRSRLEKYLDSGDIMRKESLRHASLPCAPLAFVLQEDDFYCVESTGAIVTLSSSISLIYFYCSRLPSDSYYKPTPKWDAETGTLHLPKSCPLLSVRVQGNAKILKQIACLEACKQLHKLGALTDNLVPDILVEEANAQEFENQHYDDMQPNYVPAEMVRSCSPNDTPISYHCYLIELNQNFGHEIPVHDVVLGMRTELEPDVVNAHFDLKTDRGNLIVSFKYVGIIHLNSQQILLCKRFQITLFRVLIDHSLIKLKDALDKLLLGDMFEIDMLLLPATSRIQRPAFIDWESVTSVLFSCEDFCKDHISCTLPKALHTKNGLLCHCMLKNSLVFTPHNDCIYCITDVIYDLNANSPLSIRGGKVTTYKKYYEERYDINLCFDKEPLLKGRRIFQVQNYLHNCRQTKEKAPSNTTVELPPELCSVIMSPMSLSTLYSFSHIPSIMNRLESLLVAVNLKSMHLDHCMHGVPIPTIKVLEAITTKKCQEEFHLESLETLGDSFLKYAVGQQLFKTFESNHEGLLSVKKDRIVSNAALCKLGCDHKLSGFIRTEVFDPKRWIIPGDKSSDNVLEEELLFDTRKIYISRRRKIKRKIIADVVEALIGAYLSTGGETAALNFMNWIGIEVDFVHPLYERGLDMQPEKLVNVRSLESQLNYCFNDATLLVEALTHGSYMIPEIPRCYQRLEFLGDAVLDYLITTHLYDKYPGLSPGLLTDLRAASVNNDCYARSAVKAGLHKHILHVSYELHRHIVKTIADFEKLSLEPTFGWESETSFPKVLGDVIESLAGAILVDSGYNKEIVFNSIRPLIEPLVSPETVKLHPTRELTELCQRMHYDMKKPVKSRNNGVTSITIEVEANGMPFKHTSTVSDKRIAKKIACKEVLKSLKESIPLLSKS